MHHRAEKKRGFGLVEMLVGASALSIAILSISYFFQTALRASEATVTAIQADYLLEEGVEVAKIFRDLSYKNNFLKMSTTTPSYFLWDGTKWATSTANVYIGGIFERGMTVSDTTRDFNNDIAPTGTYDPNTKLITVFVNWNSPLGTSSRSIQTYITNIYNN